MASADSPARPELIGSGETERRPGWVGLLSTGDHKDVGRLFIGSSMVFLVLAVTELVLMRIQLMVPDATLVRPEIFDRLLSAYGATGLLFFAIPLCLGLISYIVPLQIGARGVALPRVNAASFWLVLIGGLVLYASFLYTPGEGGSVPLAPLADEVFNESHGIDLWIVGVGMAIIGYILFAVNMIATVRFMRAPGMVWRRLPIFAWAATVTSWVLLIAGAVMLAALSMLFIDRNFSGVFFDPGEGGAPSLYQHLTWFFFTGAYLSVIITAMGAISEILPVFSRRPQFGHGALAAAFVGIAGLGMLAWMQNMYSAALPLGFAYFAMFAAVAMTIPVGIVIFNWIGTLAGGKIELRLPMLFALGAISTMTFGLVGELAQSVIPAALITNHTGVAWGETHYALIGAGVFGGFAALYYWFPKITGRVASEALGRASFWAMLIGVHAMILPIQLAGLEGMPADVYKFFGGEGMSAYNLIGSLGSFLLAGGIIASVINVTRAATAGVKAGPDPWHGNTLEWFALSPPELHNFDLVPDVRGIEPMRDIRDAVRTRTALRESEADHASDTEPATPVA